jgi:hypothetical protein
MINRTGSNPVVTSLEYPDYGENEDKLSERGMSGVGADNGGDNHIRDNNNHELGVSHNNNHDIGVNHCPEVGFINSEPSLQEFIHVPLEDNTPPPQGYGNHHPGLDSHHPGLDAMGVSGVSPLAMMSMHEQYPWMKEKKTSRKGQHQQGKNLDV